MLVRRNATSDSRPSVREAQRRYGSAAITALAKTITEASSPRHRDQAPGIDLEFFGRFFDRLIRIDCLDAADDLGLVGRTIDIPGHQLWAVPVSSPCRQYWPQGKYVQSD